MKRTRMRRIGARGRQRQRTMARLRPLLLQRAGGRCENPLCRKRARLDLHHLTKRSQGGGEDLNLVCVCRQCHNRLDLPVSHPRFLRILRVSDDPVPGLLVYFADVRFVQGVRLTDPALIPTSG